MISNHLCLVRGGGDLGTGVTMQLKRKGIPVVVSDLENPLAVRRKVSLSTAIIEKNVQVEESIPKPNCTIPITPMDSRGNEKANKNHL